MINQNLKAEILDWHIATFPQATLESQVLKWQEEYNELHQTDRYRAYIQELCDCIIVAIAFKRFGDVGNVLYNIFNQFVKISIDNKKENWDFDSEIIERFVDEKLKINKQRKWELVDGVYKHIKEE